MKTLTSFLLAFSLFLSSFIVHGQDDGKRKMEEDFEKYKQFREQDFNDFKKKREEELKKMQQEYQDYYNEMMGLKKYYTEKKDTAKINVVDDIISFEKNISSALGKPLKVTEEVKIDNPKVSILEKKANQQENKANTQNEPKKQSFQQAYQQANEKQQGKTEQGNTEAAPAQANTQQATNQQPAELEGTSLANLPPTERMGLPVLTPVPKIKSKITSPFGIRNHPTLNRPMKHNGVDFGTGRGIEVFSAADGKVVLAEYNRSFGNYIVVAHKDGHSSAYAHLESINVSRGSYVSKGQLLGYSGSTGRSSGPHLHYEVRINGTPVNPQDFLVETK